MNLINKLTYLITGLFLFACSSKPNSEWSNSNKAAQIYPDYSGISIPVNIAPLNFLIENEGNAYYVVLKGADGTKLESSSRKGIVQFPERAWSKFLVANRGEKVDGQIFVKNKKEWIAFAPFYYQVVNDRVDPFLYYRLLYPGYESWKEISIVQRSMNSFDEETVVKNTVVKENCVNCHAFNHQNPENFMFHMRGSMGGTYILDEGELKRFNLKTKEMKNGAVYPRWHPSGKFIAFSSNKVVQRFHSSDPKKIEVSDLNSSLVLYDVDRNEMLRVEMEKEGPFMDTYPEWSPDGTYLYFCRAQQIGEVYNYSEIKYNLYRVKFNPQKRIFGNPELVFDAAARGKSVSFPRISPQGDHLILTLHDYGCFPIWHAEADLYSINLNDYSIRECKVNSEFTESYHTWSSNGRWLVFSSKRGDGLCARPYLTYVDKKGETSKPFLLPQKNPVSYRESIKTYNIPEFGHSRVDFTPGEIRSAAREISIQAQWSNN